MSRAKGQEGVALVLALIFLSLFGVFAGVLLGFTETGVRTTQSLRSQTQKIYAMEGAVDTAINAMRNDLLAGRDPAGSAVAYCNSYSASGGGQTVTATCQGEPGSGSAVGGGASPDHGVLSLSTDPAEHGIEAVSNLSVQVNGSIFSNTDILNSGTASVMTVTGLVEALGDCVSVPGSAMISIQGALRCANTGGGAVPAHGVDPGYAPAVVSAPAYTVAPACSTGTIEMQPGTYNDVTGLNALTDGSCPNAVIHLNPGSGAVGAYYFDFRNSGSHEWVISDPTVTIVGGTKKGWIDLGGLLPPIVPFPGGCKVNSDSAPNDGVQVILGGDSRVTLSGGKMELCPQPSSTGQEISLYGLRSGTATATTVAAPSTSYGSASNVTTPAEAYAIEGSAAAKHATFTTSVLAPTASVQYSGTMPIPAGSTITSSRLRLAHSGTGSATVGLTVALAGMSGSDAVSVGAYGAYREDLKTLTRNGPIGSNLGFTITATSTTVLGSSSWKLDGAVLEVTYEPPTFRAESGCIAAIYSSGVSGCAALKASGTARLAVQGSAYTPIAPIDVNMLNVSIQIFNRGVIARVVRMGVSPIAGFSGTFSGVVRNDRTVKFSVVSGPTTLKVIARFDDDGGLTPGRTVSIQRWSVQR